MPRSRRGNKLSGADIERRAKLAGLRTRFAARRRYL